MTETTPKAAASRWLPDTGRGLWRYVLLASLMLNIAIIGVGIGRSFGHGMQEKPGGANYAMFVPRKFFFDLARERRKELAEAFRAARPDFEKIHSQTGAQAAQIATALADPAYDPAKINSLIDTFTTGQDSLAAKGGTVLKDFYAKLTPDERALLAKDIEDKLKREK
ncbi:MAG: periplasmic heavy metal sensor [Alphaproteobacteria bacterium]|nr:periplasmic heavy metal sensor [Alphaproteobacteria bacterium]